MLLPCQLVSENGINYEANTTAATLVFYAPGKTRIGIIGDFPGSNWAEKTAYQLNKTPDGNYWWLRITGLTPGIEYSYQYLVDGTLKIGEHTLKKYWTRAMILIYLQQLTRD